LFRDDLVRIDVDTIQRRDETGQSSKGLHGMKFLVLSFKL
jgi:hypothetical protein